MLLLGRQGVQQGLGSGHLLRHAFQQLVQRLRWIVAEHVAEARHEVLETRILPRDPLYQHLVQRFDHLLHALDVAVGQLVDHVLDVVEERVGHGAAQLVQQLEELSLGVGIQKLVLLEGANLSGEVGRKVRKLVAIALGDLLENVAGKVGAGLLGRGLLGRGLLCRWLVGGGAGLGMAGGVIVPGIGRRLRVEPLVDALLLHAQDFVKPLAEIFENARQVEAFQLLPLALPQLPQHVPQALHVAALRYLHAP